MKPLFHSDQRLAIPTFGISTFTVQHNIVQSMSRKGNCMDNGAIENFFGRLKVEMFYGEKFESVKAFIDELKDILIITTMKRISFKAKRNESGTIPNSFTSKLIFNFV